MKYEVLDPTKVHFGKTYSTLVEEWFNWFVTSDADKRTSGQVVFLRSIGVESYSSLEGNGPEAGNDQSVVSTYAEEPYFVQRYKNNPNIRVGRDKLQICIDQAVFFPIIMPLGLYLLLIGVFASSTNVARDAQLRGEITKSATSQSAF